MSIFTDIFPDNALMLVGLIFIVPVPVNPSGAIMDNPPDPESISLLIITWLAAFNVNNLELLEKSILELTFISPSPFPEQPLNW